MIDLLIRTLICKNISMKMMKDGRGNIEEGSRILQSPDTMQYSIGSMSFMSTSDIDSSSVKLYGFCIVVMQLKFFDSNPGRHDDVHVARDMVRG